MTRSALTGSFWFHGAPCDLTQIVVTPDDAWWHHLDLQSMQSNLMVDTKKRPPHQLVMFSDIPVKAQLWLVSSSQSICVDRSCLSWTRQRMQFALKLRWSDDGRNIRRQKSGWFENWLANYFEISRKRQFWLMVWNIFYFSIYWECHHPNWLSYFSDGFKPPTRNG